jgi:2-oxoisovalerate dehydrogenase E1 component
MTTDTYPTLDSATLLTLYRTMQVIRQTEETLARAHRNGLVHGACHTYVGQEAVATGVCAHLRTEDVVFSTHRGHGHALAKGVAPGALIAELLGRATGISHGRGGSMHLFSPETGLMGTTGIVGPCILQAAGAGYSFKLLKSDRVSVAFFGDGAVNNGAFHEGLNMASIWNLPVLFVCENNRFATEVPFEYSSGIPDVGRRAANYGLPGFEVDGNDVTSIHKIAGEAVQRARDGGGATLIECKTYRTRPHSEGMGDFTYRSKEEVEQWKTRCPIQRFGQWIIDEGTATPDELQVVADEVKADVAEALQWAENSPCPDPQTVREHVYCETPSAPSSKIQNTCPADTTRQLSYMKATLEALDEEMEKNPKIFTYGEGSGKRGGNFATTIGLFDKYGAERVFDTPICERGFVGLACGAAMVGTRPIVDFIFADFILDSVGEIVNQIAKMQFMSSGRLKMPVILRGAFGAGHSAATHHSGCYYPMYAHFPGLRVVVPSTPYDAKGLMKRAMNCDDPVLFMEHRELLSTSGPVPEEEYEIEFGKASVVREGGDITVVALALMVNRSLETAERLAEEGISVELIDPRTVSPLDTDCILRSVAKTGRLLIVDESPEPCNVGSFIAAQVADLGFDELDAPIRRVNGGFAPTPYSPLLEAAILPDAERIGRAILDLMDE